MLWVTKTPLEDVIAKVPVKYIRDKDQYRVMLKGNISAMQFDGKLNDAMAKNAMDSVAIFEPKLRDAHVDLKSTFTNHFVDQALKKYQ
jgi:hypothetical protein